jgi:hypothetical protein
LTTWADGKTLGYADSVERHYAALGGSNPPAAPTESPGTAVLQAPAPAPATTYAPVAASMSGSLQAMQHTDEDGAHLIDAVFDT